MRPDTDSPRGWHHRGYLPHFDGGEIPQSLTFRLEDSVPAEILRRCREIFECPGFPDAEAEFRRRLEAALDAGHGSQLLRRPAAAAIVGGALRHFDGERYRLHAWVMMPTHVHALFTPARGHSLSDILHNWRSFTSHAVNRAVGRTGTLWHRDYFDRFIRDDDHFRSAAAYVEENPVKARLCARPEDWPFSSAALSEE